MCISCARHAFDEAWSLRPPVLKRFKITRRAAFLFSTCATSPNAGRRTSLYFVIGARDFPVQAETQCPAGSAKSRWKQNVDSFRGTFSLARRQRRESLLRGRCGHAPLQTVVRVSEFSAPAIYVHRRPPCLVSPDSLFLLRPRIEFALKEWRGAPFF